MRGRISLHSAKFDSSLLNPFIVDSSEYLEFLTGHGEHHCLTAMIFQGRNRKAAMQRSLGEFAFQSDAGSWPLFVGAVLNGGLLMRVLVCKQKEIFKENQEFTHESNHKEIPKQTRITDRALSGGTGVDC